jgi:hypothetical protein
MSGFDLTKFVITLFILYGSYNALHGLLTLFLSGTWLWIFDGIVMAGVGLAVGLLMGYLKPEDFALPGVKTEPEKPEEK